MKEIENILKKLGHQTMFYISDEEMPTFVEAYHVFMDHVKALETINTEGVEPLAFPYEMETTFLREDDVSHIISLEDALKNAKDVYENQIKVPQVVIK